MTGTAAGKANGQFMADPLGHGLPIFIVQIVLILVMVRILGKLLNLMKQPMVIGEICAGILLGPSALGRIGIGSPNGFSARVFPPADMPVLQIFATIGLIFFMFFLGLEVDVSLMTKQWRFALPTAIVSIIFPFGIGYGLAQWMWKIDPSPQGEERRLGFNLFVGTSLSFTAFPVLARILVSMKLIHSPVGIPVLGISAIDDVIAWCVLAVVLSVASGGAPINGLWVILVTIAFIAFLAVPVNRVLTKINQYYIKKHDEMNKNFIALLFILLCIAAWFAEILGIHAFFGAFAFGAIVPKGVHLVHELAPKIELMITEFFLPLYFANSGLRTDITQLTSGEVWGAVVVTCICASVGKMLPVLCTTRLSGRSWRRSISVALLMNTRGLVTLIVLNIGIDLHILTSKVFTIMVIMSLVTTFLTSPLLHYTYGRHWAAKVARMEAQAAAQINDQDGPGGDGAEANLQRSGTLPPRCISVVSQGDERRLPHIEFQNAEVDSAEDAKDEFADNYEDVEPGNRARTPHEHFPRGNSFGHHSIKSASMVASLAGSFVGDRGMAPAMLDEEDEKDDGQRRDSFSDGGHGNDRSNKGN